MSIINIIIFYTFCSSIILSYCIGTERLFINSNSTNIDWKYFFKSSLFLFLTTLIIWVIKTYIILYLHLQFLSPFIFIMTLISINSIFNSLYRTKHKVTGENNFIYGVVFLSAYEGITLLDSMIISFSSLVFLCFLSYVIAQIKAKIDLNQHDTNRRIAPLTLISLGIITLAMYSMENSWLKYFFL